MYDDILLYIIYVIDINKIHRIVINTDQRKGVIVICVE